MPKTHFIDATRVNWHTPNVKKDGDYPGDEEMKIGCLQRIADATEKMAKNITQMENDLKWYKQKYTENSSEIERLKKSNESLRGWIKRLKK